MIKPINLTSEPILFNNLTHNSPKISQEIQNIKNIGKTKKNILIKTLAENMDTSRPEVMEAFKTALELLSQGKFQKAIEGLKELLPNEAAMKEFHNSFAIMAKG